MTQLRILLFSISIFFTFSALSQVQQDTLKYKENYGIRVGLDISKPIISFFESENKGFELVGDIRFYKNYYAAVELGFSEKTTNEDYINFTTKGSYIKAGVNYNAYKNWKGMSNEIYIGVRYAFSTFEQQLNSYTPNSKGTYFIPNTIEPNTTFNNLTAHWAELVFGLKAETFKNLYIGASVQFKRIINTKEPDNFKNLQVPGFDRVFSNDLGIGFNYTVSYLIPIIKKQK